MSKFSPADPLPYDELPHPYRLAVQTILAEPLPEFDLTHLIPEQSTRNIQRSRRRWLAQVYGLSLVGSAAVLLVVSLFAIRPVDAWAQVVKAVRKQPWVRMQAAAPDKSAQVEMWLSPTKRIGAGRFPGSAFFLELDQFKLQRYDQKENAIFISEPGSGDVDNFVALDAVLEAFANGQELKQSKAKAVKLLGQSSKKGGAGDERWTEYLLDYEDAHRSPPKFRRVFRVPEGAELPTKMTEQWTFDGKSGSRSYEMDYPAAGPADLFALDVPKDAKVVDTRSGKELKALLAAYTKQQSIEQEPYSATVLVTLDDFKYLSDAYQVRSATNGVSVEVVDGERLSDLNNRIASGEVRRPEDADRIQWWKVEVAKVGFRAVDYKMGMFFPHQVNYPLLGLPNDNVRATLNPKPFVGPGECQMLTIEDAGLGNRRYWLDSERGSMVVRWEHQPVERKAGDWFDTTIVDAAVQSPKGRWYPTEVRRGQVERSGEDLRAVTGVAPVSTQVYRYLIKFE
jgi:hypothetical protein